MSKEQLNKYSFRYLNMTTNELIKSIGKIVIDLNAEILDLLSEQKKTDEAGKMTKKGEQIGKNVKEKKKSLAADLESFESSPGLVKAENLQKTIK